MNNISGGIAYTTHVQTYGWSQGWKYNGAASGTRGEGKRLEAIRIQLTGQLAQYYDVYYRVHAQTRLGKKWLNCRYIRFSKETGSNSDRDYSKG